MTPQEMRAKRANIIAQARSKYDELTADTPEARAAEIEREFDAMMKDANDLEARADRAERLARAEASLETGDPRRPNGEGETRGAVTPPQETPMEYRAAFYELMQVGGDVHSVSPEVRQVIAAAQAETRAQVAGTDAAGGFLVPDEMMRRIVKSMAAWGPMYEDGFATVIRTTGGGSIPIPGVDDTASRAEKTAAEGQPLTDDGGKDVTFSRKTLEDYMYDTEWLRVSIQLLTGGMENMEELISDLLAERLGRTANEKLTVGTGTAEPVGIVTGASVGKNAASLAGVTADEVMELLHSVDPAYRASPKFGLMFNDNTSLALSKLKDAEGRYLLTEEGDRLKIGRVSARTKINQAMPDIGASARSMIAGDFAKYYVRKIGGVIIGTDRGKDFWPGVGIAGYTRLDGAVADNRAIKALVHPAT